MKGITIRPGTPADRIRRLLGCLPWLILAVSFHLNARKGWESTAEVVSTLTVVGMLVLDAVSFAKAAPEARRRRSAFSGVLGLLLVFALFAFPIFFPTFAGHRLGWLTFLLGVVVVAWIATEALTFVCRTIASLAIRRAAV